MGGGETGSRGHATCRPLPAGRFLVGDRDQPGKPGSWRGGRPAWCWCVLLCPASLTAVSAVAGADPEARVLGGPVRARLGVRVFGEDGVLPEPGQVSPGRPGAACGLTAAGGLRAALASPSGSGLALGHWWRQDKRQHLGCFQGERPAGRGCTHVCTSHTSCPRSRGCSRSAGGAGAPASVRAQGRRAPSTPDFSWPCPPPPLSSAGSGVC